MVFLVSLLLKTLKINNIIFPSKLWCIQRMSQIYNRCRMLGLPKRLTNQMFNLHSQRKPLISGPRYNTVRISQLCMKLLWRSGTIRTYSVLTSLSLYYCVVFQISYHCHNHVATLDTFKQIVFTFQHKFINFKADKVQVV